MSLCSNEDCDINTLRHLLSTSCRQHINVQRRAKILKWKTIYLLAKSVLRIGFSNSGLMRKLASDSGATALQHAAQRGDIDTVNLLLENGADPTIKNDLGKSPVDYCDAFPEMQGALKRFIRQQKEIKRVMLTSMFEREARDFHVVSLPNNARIVINT